MVTAYLLFIKVLGDNRYNTGISDGISYRLVLQSTPQHHSFAGICIVPLPPNEWICLHDPEHFHALLGVHVLRGLPTLRYIPHYPGGGPHSAGRVSLGVSLGPELLHLRARGIHSSRFVLQLLCRLQGSTAQRSRPSIALLHLLLAIQDASVG